MTATFRQWKDGDWFADMDSRRIARKSIFTAFVYTEGNIMDAKLITYPSRIEHCGSCLSEAEDGYDYLDECCCIHAQFHSKHEENEYVKLLGFWKIPFSHVAPPPPAKHTNVTEKKTALTAERGELPPSQKSGRK